MAGVSVEEAVAQNDRLEKLLLAEFPDEIANIWTRLGTAEVATDPMGIELSDFFLALKPREQWKKARTQGELVEKMSAFFANMPGLTVAFSQPIEMRMNELIAGIRSDIGIKIYGDDLDQLRDLGAAVQETLGADPRRQRGLGRATDRPTGAAGKVDPEAIARARRAHPQRAQRGGDGRHQEVGEVREGQRRFPLVMRLPDAQRTDPAALAATLIPTASGAVVPLERVAKVTEAEGPATINREWGKRRITVQCNVRGRDVAGFVKEAREKIAAKVKLPEGYHIEWGGQFENMERANRKLAFVVPLALS